jgi:hypothetical protein
MAPAYRGRVQKGPNVSDAHRAALVALYAALAAVVVFPLSETTRRALRGALAALGRDLGIDSHDRMAS